MASLVRPSSGGRKSGNSADARSRRAPRCAMPAPARSCRSCAHAAHPASLVSSPIRPCGPEDHDDHQVDEDDRRRPVVADAVVGDALDDPDDQPAEHGAADVADAAHHRRGERVEAGREALEVPDRGLVERADQAGRARHQAAEQERQRDRRVDVDAHQPRGLRVLRGGAHRLAEPAAADEAGQQDHQRDRHGDGQHVAARDGDAPDARTAPSGTPSRSGMPPGTRRSRGCRRSAG